MTKSITTYVISDVTYGDVSSTRSSIPASGTKGLIVKSHFNKSHNDIIWSYQPEENGTFQVRLFDLNGQMVKQLYSGFMKADCNYQGNISSLELCAGVFILSAEGCGKRMLQRCTIGR